VHVCGQNYSGMHGVGEYPACFEQTALYTNLSRANTTEIPFGRDMHCAALGGWRRFREVIGVTTHRPFASCSLKCPPRERLNKHKIPTQQAF